MLRYFAIRLFGESFPHLLCIGFFLSDFRTELRGPPEHQEAAGTGEMITLPTELVLTSIGYRSIEVSCTP